MARLVWGVLGAWFFFCTGSALKCEYDASVDERQGLDFTYAAGQVTTETVDGVSDPDRCRELCCNSSECDMVQMGYPMDGLPQCMLVRCRLSGHDACRLKPSPQFKVYRKTSSSRRRKLDGNEPRVVPLVQSFQPKESNESSNGKRRRATPGRLALRLFDKGGVGGGGGATKDALSFVLFCF